MEGYFSDNVFGSISTSSAYVINKESDRKINGPAVFIFASIMISSPVISDMYIFATYNLEITIGYVLSSISLILFQTYIKSKNMKDAVYSTIVIALAICIYESFIPVFICQVCILFISLER